MRKILTSLALASTLTVATITAAPAGAKTPPPAHLHVSDNKPAFNHSHTGAFTLRVTAHHKNGNALNGKARLYINGHHLRTRDLKAGRIIFHIGRSKIPNNKVIKVKVRVTPWNTHMRDKLVIRHVIDRPKPKPKVASGSKVVKAARSQVGDRYRLGANGPNVWDCSALTRYAVKKGTGKTIPRTSSAQRSTGRSVPSPKPGDIVWTEGHVAIYSGNGRVIEAATPATGVVERQMWQSNPEFRRP